MAGELTTQGTNKALLVVDAATKQPIDIPLNAQEGIMRPIVALQTWILSRMRTGGTGKVEIGGKVWYYAYPKQMQSDRNIEIEYNADGTIKSGMYGADADATFGYVKPTSKTKLVKDYVEPVGAKFLKHLFATNDLKDVDLSGIVSMALQDWTDETLELELVKLKAAWVASFGTIGKLAQDAGYTTLPTTGTGKRVQAKDYTKGEDAVADIKAVLDYKERMGLKDGNETAYPFLRGQDIVASTLITISGTLNNLILNAVADKASAYIPGLSFNKEAGVITGITTTSGKMVKVEVSNDVPAKAGKAFNWSVEEIGKHGAIAMPNTFDAASQLRPHYEGNALTGKILEAVGLVMGFKALQPELNFASFGA